MNACQLNFATGITCITNQTVITINATRAPYICVNNMTGVPCSNSTQCCNRGYEFDSDVQQCLCKYKITE
jgi:hypothetical protein